MKNKTAMYNNRKLTRKAKHWYENDTYEDKWVKVQVLGSRKDVESDLDGWYLIKLPNGDIKETTELYL